MTPPDSKKPVADPDAPWWKDGVRFECRNQRCCCVTHGECSYVFVNRQDRERLAEHLGLAPADFARRFCDRIGYRWYLRDAPGSEACLFLSAEGCGVYEARPTQCRTWPFWPENMDEEAWARVAAFCPGIGRGRRWSAEQIAGRLAEQAESEDFEPEEAEECG